MLKVKIKAMPDSITLTKNEVEAFEQLKDRKAALNRLLLDYGFSERLLTEGLMKKYKLDKSFSWNYNTVEKILEVSHQYPDWGKERLK